MAKRISVVVGFSETIRVGAAPMRTVSPKSSIPYAAPAVSRVRRSLHAANNRAKAHIPRCARDDSKLLKSKRHLSEVGEVPGNARKLASATGSSPEETESWRERRSSPGSGPLARLPDRSQWRVERQS